MRMLQHYKIAPSFYSVKYDPDTVKQKYQKMLDPVRTFDSHLVNEIGRNEASTTAEQSNHQGANIHGNDMAQVLTEFEKIRTGDYIAKKLYNNPQVTSTEDTFKIHQLVLVLKG